MRGDEDLVAKVLGGPDGVAHEVEGEVYAKGVVGATDVACGRQVREGEGAVPLVSTHGGGGSRWR